MAQPKKINEPFFVFILHNTPQTFCEQNFLKQFYEIVIQCVFSISMTQHERFPLCMNTQCEFAIESKSNLSKEAELK